jgi:hypothetical protein
MSMEAKMRYHKVDKIVEELKSKCFDMTTSEFLETTIYELLRKYGITEQLDLDEYFELLRRLMDICAENDLKNMGINYLNNNDWKYK